MRIDDRLSLPTSRIVEQLTFEISPDRLETFLRIDEEVWTAFLMRQPGFVRKEVWLSRADPAKVVAQIWWTSREQWKDISRERVEEVDSQMGEHRFQPQCAEYQVVRQAKVGDD